MKISLEHISKRFQRHWIFKDINYTFANPGSYALLGQNGSGKSTLLRVIAGMQPPSKGKVMYEISGSTIENGKTFKHISFCAPGMEIVEEMTFTEFLRFHFSFKKSLPAITVTDIIQLTGLTNIADKPISDYSSGMKQRVKLAQAIFTASDVLLLDEPCTNLDQQGVEQYLDWMELYSRERLVIIASNDSREYTFCQHHIALDDYK